MGCCKSCDFMGVGFWCIIVLSLVHFSLGLEHGPLKWEVEYMFKSPDCVENTVMGVNGRFPGPTIRVKEGDTIVVDGVVIHWHGIRQIGTAWADGTASISQCAINPGDTFRYNFTADKSGTYFYHGHYGMQRSAGLYGSLIVEDKEKNPYCKGEKETNCHKYDNEPQSLLINGRGQFVCSLASNKNRCEFPERKESDCAPERFKVEPNKIYRLRIASTTALASLNLAIEGHTMKVVEADGNYVKPFDVTDLYIYSGESYSDPTNPRRFNLNRDMPKSEPPITPAYKNYARGIEFAKNLKAREGSLVPIPYDVSRDPRIILLNTQNKINGLYKWSINNVSLVLPSTPYLGSLKFKLDNTFNQASPPDYYDNTSYHIVNPNSSDKFDPNTPQSDYDVTKPPTNINSIQGSGIYNISSDTTVEVILQNANMLQKLTSEIHPWHLHGHDFWVLGYGEGKFKQGDEKTFNEENPPLKNTVAFFPHGWTALRFRADNPGVWAFHCHIEPHLHMGMGVVFAEGIDKIREMKIPRGALACGLTAPKSDGRRARPTLSVLDFVFILFIYYVVHFWF